MSYVGDSVFWRRSFFFFFLFHTDLFLFSSFFGPDKSPMLQVGFRGNVEVDAGFHARFSRLPDYERTVGPGTWNAVNKYAADIKKRNIKIAFFSATPQGGGVALMRHALVRFANVLGVDMKW